jgi:hypothetical protein
MKKNDRDSIENPLFRLALVAMKRAAKTAQEQAIIHNTQLVIWRDNRVVKLSPNEIGEKAADYQPVSSPGKI